MRRAHRRCPSSNATRGNVAVAPLVDGAAIVEAAEEEGGAG